MSKKRAKSGSGSAGASRWESGLLATPFEEEGWTAFVGSVIPNELADKEYAAFLCSSVSSGIRKLFSIITYEGLIEEVNELGNPKGKRPKDVPAFSEICETAKTHLDSNEPIPLPLLAKLIKWKLLAIKDADVKRREQEGKEASGKESKEKKSGKKSARGKSAKGKGKKSPEIPSPKKESKLKKRGEDDEENKYIDDEPDDGPQHYILLYGFLEAPLLVLLSDLGINVNCILRLNSEDYSLFDKRKAEKEEEEEEFQRPQEVIEAEQAAKTKATEELERFWKQYEPLLLSAFKGSSLHDIARLTYTVKNELIPEEYDDADQQTEFGTALFEDVACMIYDLLDKKRQYKNYQDNMKLVEINASQSQPEVQLTASGAAVAARAVSSSAIQPPSDGISQAGSVDTRYYKDLMDTVPAESCSVPLIMHCMLEQVVATEEGEEPPSAKLHQLREDGLDHGLAAHIDSISAKFNIGQTSSKTEAKVTPEVDSDTQFPVFYHYGDKTSEKLRHLDHIDGFDALKGEEAMIKLLPVSRVTKFPRPSAAVMKQRSARLHELLHKCFKEGMDTAEMDHILRKFVFESLILRSTDSRGHVQADEEMEGEIVWDDPYIIVNKKTEPVQMDPVPENQSPVAGEEKNLSPEINRSTTPGGGILKVESKSRQGSASSIRSSKSQVHFEDGVQAQRDFTEGDVKKEDSNISIPDKKRSPTPSLISIQDVADKPQRLLDEWCFVEHLKPNVLLQVLDEARMLCPYMDTYYHRKDHSLLIVMHNPIDSEKKNIITWDAKLHSNVGFRNYLEHVANYIEDWTGKEEEKYQAEMREKELAAELAAAQAAAASAAASPSASRPGSSKARNRSQSPKKSRSKSPKGRGSESPAPAANLDPNSSSFMRPNSMKAWKVEHDKQLAEEEKKKQDKDKKGKKSARSRSASPKKDEKDEKGKDKKDDSKKRTASGRGSRKGDKEKKDAGAAEEEKGGAEEIQEPPQPERYYPFVGYDVGNKMIHANGSLTSLFPTDGGIICCEKTEFISGDVFVNTTVLKDGHVLTVHILDPKEPVEEEPENDSADASKESQEEDRMVPGGDHNKVQPLPSSSQKPLSSFGSITASLSDGMVLSISNFGKSGTPKIEEEKPEVEVVIPPVASPSPPPPAASPSRGRGGSGKRSKKGAPSAVGESEKASQKPSEQPKEEEAKLPEPTPPKEPEEPPFQQLFISCPNGLHVSYKLESIAGRQTNDENAPGKMLIKQNYPSKTAGQQPCEAAIQNPAMTEHCRFISSEGAVIKFMMDGRTEVLFPTGVVSKAALVPIGERDGSPSQSREGSPQRGGSAMSNHLSDAKKGNMKVAGSKTSVPPSMDPLDESACSPGDIVPFEWITTTLTGDRFGTRADGTKFEEKAVMLYSARDPVTDEVMTTREDKVVIVERPDGTKIVDHSDGTRITSYTVDVEYREMNGETEETGEATPVKVRTVQQVKVECVGYATVIFNTEDGIATTIFGNGTQVIAIPDGSYEILHHDGSRMAMASDGCVQFTPKPGNGDNGATEAPAMYTLHHKEKIVCQVKESTGKNFSVNWKGELLPDEEKQKSEGKTQEEGEAEGVGETETNQQNEKKIAVSHVPRYFVVNSDGSGCELLREKDLSSYFQQMEMDPTTAFIQEPLPDHPEVQGMTVMKPYLTNVSDTWLLKFDEENIVPKNLRPRDFSQLPAKEVKKPGVKFGTNVGKGLAVGSKKIPPELPPAPQCPRYLQLRQFTQYKPVDVKMRKEMEACLEAHAKEVLEQEKIDAERQLKDPRSEEEKIQAGDLLAQILAQDEDQQKSDEIEGRKQEAVTGQQLKSESDLSPVMAKPTDVENPEKSKELYETATAPEPLPPPPKPHNKYTDDDWNRVRLTLEEEQANREALRKREVPPYFDSQWGKSFLAAQAATPLEEPDMEALTKKLAEGTKQGTQPPSDSLPSTPDNSPASDQQGGGDMSQPSDVNESPFGQTPKIPMLQTPREGDSPFVQGVNASPSDVRPTNPTPGHAGGVGTPTQVRPTNPTPAHASQPQPLNRPGNPTASSDSDVSTRNLPSDTPSSYASFPNHPSTIPEQVEEQDDCTTGLAGDKNGFNSEVALQQMSSETLVYPDSDDVKISSGESASKSVSGPLKRSPVRLPAAIQGQKPGALPNQQFQAVEEPVRRKVMTSSLAGLKVFGDKKVSTNRGFELVPGEVFFGELREGCTYVMPVNLKNIGIDSCRYKVKQPPPATGLQVIYKPGPVAAGMKAQLQIQLYAIAVGVEGESGRGSIGHHLEITTETDFIFLPVSAYILTAHEYDELCRTKGRPYLAPGVQLLSSKPPSREGIIRPRKETPKKDSELSATNT